MTNNELNGFSLEELTIESDRYSKFEELVFLAEQDLRRLAHNFLKKENTNHSFETVDLLNETLIKLMGQTKTRWQNHSHLVAVSAKIMRRILLNHARDKVRQKRGGSFEHCSVEDVVILSEEKSKHLIDLEEALQKLEKLDELKSQIVELRFFAGLTVEEIAHELDISPSTVWLHWRFAKAWLSKEISSSYDSKK